jgi:hypothetical protein
MQRAQSSKERNMKRKIIIFSCLAWAIAVISSPSPVKAVAAIPGLQKKAPQDVTEVVVTANYRVGIFTVFCGDNPRIFNYQQLMTIPGVGMVWAETESVYSAGPQVADLQEENGITCVNENGEKIYFYGLGDCSC